ncbi:MAG: hypothetical protein MSA13_06540 [Prevotella sp.]|nr:hypothetical protein [Prevotella sp.]
MPEEIHKPAENEVLFKDNLPAQTIKQRTNMDCVSTSLGIISELSGSVQTAENVRENIEEMYRRMTGVLLEEDGVDSSCYLNMLLTESGLPYVIYFTFTNKIVYRFKYASSWNNRCF